MYVQTENKISKDEKQSVYIFVWHLCNIPYLVHTMSRICTSLLLYTDLTMREDTDITDGWWWNKNIF